MSFIVRNLQSEEMDFAIELAAQEGWNPGLNDGDCFFKTDPNGFFVGELDGEIIACKSAVKYGNKFGFMGFYIVKKKYRAQGYGIKIWQHAFNYLGGLTSGMDGVVEQQVNYKKSGYKFAYRQLRYVANNLIGKTYSDVIDLNDVPFEDVLKYDNEMFPAPRPTFLKCWLTQPNISAKVILAENKIIGYGVIRPCRVGFKIGPLFAENANAAEKLFLSLAEFADGKEIYLDIPEANDFATALVRKYNMKYVFECARMYYKGEPKINLNKVFGNTTFELG
ncbi:MAG: GNAT family N-acetyltransferase [Ignavibacteriales bacterium]|nr:GNAT family N-acetyltransferase [Ignavibacteriales bacterium]